MIPWKKKQPFQQPFTHVQQDPTDQEKIKNLESRIAKLEAQPVQPPPVVLYKLDVGEDVLVQCVVGDERVYVPLSQIVAHAVPAIVAQVEQAMVTKVRLAGPSRSRAVKIMKQQPEGEQK